MDNQISYAPKAREDLLEIKSFIEEETGDIELARKTISYLNFYRYFDQTIYIDRILNSRRDYLRILLDEVH